MKTEWRATTLGELVTVKHGWSFKGRYFAADGSELVLTPGNFRIGGGLKIRPGKDRYYTGEYPTEFQLTPGDLLVVMTDLTQNAPILGSPAFVPIKPTMLHNQRLGLVTVKSGVDLDRRFLYYLLLSDVSRSQLRATATGTTVRHTAPERIYRVSVGLPRREVQHAVGAILGAIDDLIENNRRRVAVLEEMARAIYREWFVHFRYPGREDATLVDTSLGSVPVGWTVTTVGQVLELRYGRALKTVNRRGGPVAVVSSAGVVGWHDAHLVLGPSIVVGRKGNVGSVTWVDGPAWPIDTAYFVQTKLPLRYVFEQLRRTEFLNTHAAVPGLSREQAYSRPFLQPSRKLMAQFSNLSEALASQASAIAAQARQLVVIRDLLLPKLVTGQIDVSSLDLDAHVEGSVA